MRHVWLFLLVILIAHSTNAQIYKWVDKDGMVHFSDTKPENQQVEQKNYDVEEKPLDPEMVKYREDMDTHLQSMQLKEALEKEEEQLAARKALEKKRHCNQLKSNFIMDERISTVYTRNADGSRRAMSAEEREKRRQEMKAQMDKDC